MAPSQKDLHKYIVWGLLASTILFLILFILFTILFATKDDNSSSFLLSGSTGSGYDAVLKDVKDKLSKKFHINDIHLEVVASTVTGVFSLRGKQTLSKVQVQINLATTITNSIVTDGTSAYSTCRSSCDSPIVCPTSPPPITTRTTPPTSTIPTPVHAFYCNDPDLQREIVVVVDLRDDNVNAIDRKNGLTTLGAKMAQKFAFGPTRVYLLGVDVNGRLAVSTNFISTSDDFTADWKKLLATKGTDSQSDTLGMNNVFDYIKTKILFDPKKPIEVVVLAAHQFENIDQGNLLNSQGFFVAVAKATQFGFDNSYKQVSSTGVLGYANFVALAADDPFTTLACQFSYQDNSLTEGFLLDIPSYQELKEQDVILADAPNNTCQKVDILFVFDTSISVTSPLLEDYKEFAINFAARFTMSGDPLNDNIQVGIIQFSNTAQVLMQLSHQTYQNFAAFIRANIVNTGGMTNTRDALQRCIEQFNSFKDPAHGQFVVFMTDGHATVGDLTQTEQTGQTLSKLADIFFVGDGKYDKDSVEELTAINNHPEWIYNTTDSAMDQLPAVVLQEYPCKAIIRVCEVAYYAIEVSEAVDDVPSATLNDSLAFAINAIDAYNAVKPNASYQLMIYNAVQKMVPNTPTDYKTISNILKTFNRDLYTAGGNGGHVDLDGAFYYLADAITAQTLLYNNVPYHSSVVFCGEANYYTIDPLNNVQNVDKAQLLVKAYQYLSIQTNDIYVFDGSQGNSHDYGKDLWTAAVPARNIVNDTANAFQNFLGTTYYHDIQSYTCNNILESIARCDYNFIDVAVVLDIVGDNANITSYLTTLIGQFATGYPSHFSMFAMGDGNGVVILEELQAWPDVTAFTSSAFAKWEQWKIHTTTAATTIKAAPFFEDPAQLVSNYPMDNNTLQGMFNSIRGQFGCEYYGYSKDRVDAPNIVLIVSDNFATYTDAMWNSFPDLITQTWGCNDCAGKPQFFFMSLTNTAVNHGDGQFQITGDLYNLNLPLSIRTMSSIVNSMCGVKMPNCLTLDMGVMCSAQPAF